MRLIDADALISKLKCNSIFEKITDSRGMNVIEIICEQPTAYDLDKVVAGLENLQDTDTREVYFTKHICLDDAINIVREGV